MCPPVNGKRRISVEVLQIELFQINVKTNIHQDTSVKMLEIFLPGGLLESGPGEACDKDSGRHRNDLVEEQT